MRKYRWYPNTIGLIVALVLISAFILNPWQNGKSVIAADNQDDPEVDPELLALFNRSGSSGYFITFDAKADLSPAYDLSWEERGQFVYDRLTQTAEESQKDVRAYLDKEGVSYKAYWIQNVITVTASTRAAFQGLFSYPEIRSLEVIPPVYLVEPDDAKESFEERGLRSAEDNLTHIHADDAWALGWRGAGMVVGSIDTGARYTHEILFDHYRGNQMGGLVHDYNWWDAVNDRQIPYDDHNHGTHTIGTMVGDDGAANQTGVAPEASWVACKALNSAGSGGGQQLIECGQFMLAPTRLDGTHPDPALRPHVINNSWGDCDRVYDDWYEDTIDAWLAAGIYPVFANGNASNCGYTQPPGLNTVGNPARSYHVTAVGSTGRSNGVYAPHANWGPTDSFDVLNPMGYPTIKPQVVAPGVSIRSATAGTDSSYGYYSGTSMSAPHVAALIALMWQAGDCLVGQVVQTETLLELSANPIPYATGNGDEGPGMVPNHATGWGEINAHQAAIAARDYCGDSTLSGYVLDAVTAAPIPGADIRLEAQVDPTNDREGITNAEGYFDLPIQSGDTYVATAGAYGFYEMISTPIAVPLSGTNHEMNFDLDPKAAALLTGVVEDGSGHDFPLYSEIGVRAGRHFEQVLSNPFDGVYQVSLFVDTPYDLVVSPLVGGYAEVVENNVILTAPTVTHDIASPVGPYCDAPGYRIARGLFEPFDQESIPSGWTVIDNIGEGVVWRFDDPAGRSNRTGGQGRFAIVDSDFAGLKAVDTELISPSLDFSDQTIVTLSFDQDFFYYMGSRQEVADVDVSVAGGPWHNVLRQTEAFPGPNHQEIDLSAIAGHQADVRIRFRYYDATFDWWWQVDNIRVGPYVCAAEPGGALLGYVTRETDGAPINGIPVTGAGVGTSTFATPNDPRLEDGFFWLFQPLQSLTEVVTFIVGGSVYVPRTADVILHQNSLTRQDFVLDSYQSFISVHLR